MGREDEPGGNGEGWTNWRGKMLGNTGPNAPLNAAVYTMAGIRNEYRPTLGPAAMLKPCAAPP
eukprot:11155539-Lingulodinium_polyedra.AAC.1